MVESVNLFETVLHFQNLGINNLISDKSVGKFRNLGYLECLHFMKIKVILIFNYNEMIVEIGIRKKMNEVRDWNVDFRVILYSLWVIFWRDVDILKEDCAIWLNFWGSKKIEIFIKNAVQTNLKTQYSHLYNYEFNILFFILGYYNLSKHTF